MAYNRFRILQNNSFGPEVEEIPLLLYFILVHSINAWIHHQFFCLFSGEFTGKEDGKSPDYVL